MIIKFEKVEKSMNKIIITLDNVLKQFIITKISVESFSYKL